MEKLQQINPLHERFGYLSLVAYGVVLALIGLFVRSHILITIINFVLEVIGWIAIIGGIAVALAGVAAFGHEKGWWDKIIASNQAADASAGASPKIPMFRGLSGAGVSVLILIFFIIPWVSFSCLGEEIVTLSATDIMAITSVEELDDALSQAGEDEYGITDAIASEAALLYIAALLAIAGGALFFLPGKKGNYIRAGISGAGILSLVLYLIITIVQLGSEAADAGVEISWKIGFYLAVLGFIAATALQLAPLPFADAPKENGADDATPADETP